MNRQVRLAALATATLAAGVGFASGQSPPPAAPAGSTANAGPVYVMKTAGQPERRVQVLKSETQSDGSILTDVKDLASGTVYTLTNPSFLGNPVAPSVADAKPIPAPIVTRPQLAADPNSPRPLFGQFPNQRTAAQLPRERLVPVDQVHPSTLPQARDRKADPLLAGASPAAIAARTPFKVVSAEPPTVMGKVFGDPTKSQPAPRVGVLPTAQPIPKAVASIPKSTPGVTVVMPNIAPATVPKLEKAVAVAPPTLPATPVPVPTVVPAGIAIPPIDANAKPSAATGLFDSQSSGVAVALPPIIEPNTAPLAVQPTTPPVAVAAAPPPVPEVTKTAVAIEVPPVTVPLVAIPVPEVAVPEVAVPTVVAEPAVSTELPKDVRLMIEDLKNHKRPSFRMESATSLAESQFAKHPACIEALVHAATNDKAGVVRGHCIARLSELGHSEATFLKSLETWSSDLEPAVQRAAVAAKAKLVGR